MKQEGGPALAKNRAGAEELLHVRNAAKRVVVISDDVIRTEKSVELDGVEMSGASVGADAVHDEIKIAGKLLDLRIVARLAAVFDRERMKMKNIELDAF